MSRTFQVSAFVGDVDVEVSLGDFDTEELLDELEDRGYDVDTLKLLVDDVTKLRHALYRGEDLKAPVENLLKRMGYIV